jgi:hypothetical protein
MLHRITALLLLVIIVSACDKIHRWLTPQPKPQQVADAAQEGFLPQDYQPKH